MSLFRVGRLLVVGVLAVVVVLSACGGDSPAQTTVAAGASSSMAAGTAVSVATTTTTTASTAASTGTTTPVGATSPVGVTGAGISVDAGTVWADVFGIFAGWEQSCIRDAVDEELLELVLDRPVVESFATPEGWAVSIFSCLAPDTARALFLSLMIAGIESDEGLDVDLTEVEMSCLGEWVAGFDVAAAVGAFADEYSVMAGELASGMLSCLPGLFLAVMLDEMGVAFGELGDDEVSCLRESLPSGVDFEELFASDPETVSAVVPGLVECVHDLVDAPPDPGTLLNIPLEDATPVPVDAKAQSEVDEPGDSDLFVFEATEGELYQIDVALGTLADSVVTLYDADGRELAANDDYEDSLASRVFWVAPSTGNYYVKVSSWGAYTGSYTLTVVVSDVVDDHADDIDDATSVLVGEPVLGVVDYPGDIDFFVFEAIEGELYQIDVALGTLPDSVVTLYHVDGSELAANDDYQDSPASRILWTAPSTGSYYIKVSSWYPEGTGTYTLISIVR